MFSTFVGLGRFINCQRPNYVIDLFTHDFKWHFRFFVH